MKNRFRSKAPPGGIFRWWLGIVLALALLLPISVHAQQELTKTTDLPDYTIESWADVWRPDILMFGRWIQALGDINDDGYDDVAVASSADTTFIFLGGKEFSHEPVLFLRGGGGGIATGDFNGDGHIDLVTAIVQAEHRLGEPDPGYHGRIRFYLGRGPQALFDTIPDLMLQGREMEAFGFKPNQRRPGVTALDFNGDGYSDLLVHQYKIDSIPRLCFALYRGGATLDSVPVAYLEERRDFPPDHFSEDLMIGDLNGDGKDDVLVEGSNAFGSTPGRVDYWDLYFGNDGFKAAYPDRIISSDKGWSPAHSGFSDVFDINVDGYADIIDGLYPEDPGDLRLFLSSRSLPETIVPNDTIFNLAKPGVRKPKCVCPAGDMNGDGRDDLLVAWSSTFFPFGDLYLLYPGSTDGAYKTPLGGFGVLRDELYLTLGAYAIGDANGDGCDDVAVVGQPGIGASPKTYRFRIYLGSTRMRTSLTDVPTTSTFDITIHPNPLSIKQDIVNLTISSQVHGPVELRLVDVLGRLISRRSIDLAENQQSIVYPVHDVSPGAYSLIVTQGEKIISRSIIKY